MPTATARYTSNSSISLKQFQMRLQSVAGYVVQAGYCQIRIYWASGCLMSLVAHLECSLIREHKVKIPARTAAPYATASFGLICSGALLDELVHVWDLCGATHEHKFLNSCLLETRIFEDLFHWKQ